jgi:hypothetical protein
MAKAEYGQIVQKKNKKRPLRIKKADPVRGQNWRFSLPFQ